MEHDEALGMIPSWLLVLSGRRFHPETISTNTGRSRRVWDARHAPPPGARSRERVRRMRRALKERPI